jgi:eukaryotic-like serine/threonine-protein kinase
MIGLSMVTPDFDPAIENAAMQLLETALERPSVQRIHFIEAQTGLAEHVRARALQLLGLQDQLLDSLQTGGAAIMETSHDLPDQIGTYKVIRLLGRGGMGSVYLAERSAADFVHKVAIKIIKSGVYSDTLIERFRRERQTLAELNHPHIARLYDAGETDVGTPYLVMEYVDGTTLADWLRLKEQSLNAIVTLFLQICSAVEFAHQNLIIHRDLTPGNVLVTHGDSAKLIDFGIARLQLAASERDPKSTLSELSLTPGFDAPERAAGVPANTLVDIYSLGKILQTMMSHSRSADGDHVELKAIADKSMSTNPNARYPTVSAMIAAIEDWRQHRPVEAYSVDQYYRFRKFLVRQKRLVCTISAVFAILLISLAFTLWAYNRAERERAMAEQRFAEIRNLSIYLVDDVVRELDAIPGTASLRQRIGELGGKALEQLSKVPGAPVELRAETARAYQRIGEALASPDFASSGSSEMALNALARSVTQNRQLLKENPGQTKFRLELARSITAHAFRLVVLENDTRSAEKMLGEVDMLLAQSLGSEIGLDLAKLALATARASVYAENSEYTKLYPHIDQSIAFARSIQPQNQNEKFAVASALNSLNVYLGDALYYDREDLKNALAAYEASVEPLIDPAFAADIRVLKMRVFGSHNLASTLFELGRKDEAVAISREGIELAKRMRLFDASIRSIHLEAIVHGEYSLELFALGRVKEAEEHAAITLDIRRELARRMPKSYEAQRLVPVAQRALGEALEPLGNRTQACAYYRDALIGWGEIARSASGISRFDQENNVGWLEQRRRYCL